MSTTVESERARIASLEANQKPSRMRWYLLAIIFITGFIAYLDRVNISVLAPVIMKDFGFDKVDYAATMTAFTLGYMLMQIPGGFLTDRYGIRKVGMWAMIFWSIFTVLTPMASTFFMFLMVRFLFGCGEGPMFPNNGSFVASWFSPKEKAIASSTQLAGAFLGPALGPPIVVFLFNMFGWKAVFFLFGILGFIIGPIWYFMSRELPSQHPKVNKAELDLITENGTIPPIIRGVKKAKLRQPWAIFLRSGQFWSYGLQYFVVNFILYVFLTFVPLYLVEERHLTMEAMGAAAAYPWFAVSITILFSGRLSDWLLRKGFNKFVARSCFGMLGLAISAISLYMAGHSSGTTENIIWLTLSFGSLGFTYTSTWTICQDLGQRHAVTCVSWMQVMANLGGVVAPLTTAFLVKFFGWQFAFNFCVCLVASAIVLWLFVRPDKPLEAPGYDD